MLTNPNHSPEEIGEPRLLIWLTACFYSFFTLIPDSHSAMVSWPYVAFWQIALLCPIIWLLWSLWHQGKIFPLGNGLDWAVGLGVIGLIISSVFAPFPHQARWYAWAALGFIAALYALNQWITSPQRRYRLLVRQGYLSLAFIVVSLFLWTFETLLPELNRLEKLRQYGINISYDFSVLELRNWAPLGHQNYVAGYLLLALALLITLTIIESGWRRWLWGGGVTFGLIALYTTSSRGGWLGLVGLCLFWFVVLLLKSSLNKLWLGLGGLITFLFLLLLVLANNRLLTLITAVFQGQTEGELAYRIINTVLGWRMGISHPFSGVGLGGVPILYQKYRPIWAGRESELAYQLHSTPAQLWAEMGLWGILPVLGGIVWLIYCFFRRSDGKTRQEQLFIWGLSAGLFAYALMSLTDYQLDNICISGIIIIYLVCLASIFNDSQRYESQHKFFQGRYFLALIYSGVGIVLVMSIWLIPIHYAWLLSSQGFVALGQDKLETFVNYLTQANKLAPWEPYYPFQLGYNLGNFSLSKSHIQLTQPAIAWFEKGNEVSPYQEFGHSNLGWLLLRNNSTEATKSFLNSAQLLPAKRGVMYGLGLSLLLQRKPDLAVEAISLECLRDPLFITSPIWRSPDFKNLHEKVLERTNNIYDELLEKYSDNKEFQQYLHQARGGIFWWQGKTKEAQADLDKHGTSFSQGMLALTEGKLTPSMLSTFPTPARLIIEAWNNTTQRENLIQKAWLEVKQTSPPEEIMINLLTSMEKSDNFSQWLKEKAPLWKYSHQRAGFGVLSRHIDGIAPLDFYPIVENLALTTWFSELLPSPVFYPPLDLALQPYREQLFNKIGS